MIKIMYTVLLLFLPVNVLFSQEGGIESKKNIDTEYLKELIQDKEIRKSDNPFTITLTADFVSKDIWRGTIATEGFCVQPLLSFDYMGITIGTLGSHALKNAEFDVNEFWLSYNLDCEIGSLIFTLYDYHSSAPGIEFFNFKSDGSGSHIPELQLQYSGSDNFPFRLMAAYNLYNDPEKSFYFESGFTVESGLGSFDICAGFTKGPSAIYFVGENKFAFINAGISFSKTIKINQDLTIPLNLSYILNGYMQKGFIVFRLSI